MSFVGDGSTYFTGQFATNSAAFKPFTLMYWYRRVTVGTVADIGISLGHSSQVGLAAIRTTSNTGQFSTDNVGTTFAGNVSSIGALSGTAWNCGILAVTDTPTQLTRLYGNTSSDRAGAASYTTTVGPAQYDTLGIGTKVQAGVISAAVRNGNMIAECALWQGVALGLDDCSRLFAGANPLLIESDSIQWYFPLIDNFASYKAQNMLLSQGGSTNALKWGEHPPVDRFVQRKTYFMPASGPANLNGAANANRPAGSGAITNPRAIKNNNPKTKRPSASGVMVEGVQSFALNGVAATKRPSVTGALQTSQPTAFLNGTALARRPTAKGAQTTGKNITGAAKTARPLANGSIRLAQAGELLNGAAFTTRPSASGQLLLLKPNPYGHEIVVLHPHRELMVIAPARDLVIREPGRDITPVYRGSGR